MHTERDPGSARGRFVDRRTSFRPFLFAVLWQLKPPHIFLECADIRLQQFLARPGMPIHRLQSLVQGARKAAKASPCDRRFAIDAIAAPSAAVTLPLPSVGSALPAFRTNSPTVRSHHTVRRHGPVPFPWACSSIAFSIFANGRNQYYLRMIHYPYQAILLILIDNHLF